MHRDDTHLEQVRQLLHLVARDNPFYAKKFAEYDTNLLSLEDFFRLPFTTRSEWVSDQIAHPPYGTNLTYPLEAYNRYSQTSGSTGIPMRWLDTPESWQWMLDNWRIVYDRAGITHKHSIFFAFSFGPFLGFWTAYEAACQMGSLCFPSGGMSTAARLRMIRANRIDALCCTPTYAIHLGEAASHHPEHVDATHSVRRIIVAGEPGGSVPAVRERITYLWPHAEIVDHHGMTEVGPVSYQEIGEPGVLRIIESSYLAEVVDINEEGIGELVLTTLGRTGSPLIRYRTGDTVRPRRDPGRDLALVGGIVGRADDMVIVRGVNLFPSSVDAVLRRFPECAEYEVRIKKSPGAAEIDIVIEPLPTVNPDTLMEQIGEALREAFPLRIGLFKTPPYSLPRHEFKAKRWHVEQR